MNRLNLHKQNIINYDFIFKLNLKNIFQIPKINKFIISISLKDSILEKKKIIPVILYLNILSGQKSFLTKSKKNKIHLKIKKGMVTGCKITLRSKNLNIFFEKLLIFYFPKINNFKGFLIKHNNRLSFNIKNSLNFFEFENEFLNFQHINKINCTLVSNTLNIEILKLLLNSFNFPIKK